MTGQMILLERHWYGLDVTAEHAPSVDTYVTPFFITAIKPLKTGSGLLRTTGIAAFHFPKAASITLTIGVTSRRSTYLGGTEKKTAGSVNLVVFARVDMFWLRSCCGTLLLRWLSERFFVWDVKPELNDPADEYLTRAFRKDADEI